MKIYSKPWNIILTVIKNYVFCYKVNRLWKRNLLLNNMWSTQHIVMRKKGTLNNFFIVWLTKKTFNTCILDNEHNLGFWNYSSCFSCCKQFTQLSYWYTVKKSIEEDYKSSLDKSRIRTNSFPQLILTT